MKKIYLAIAAIAVSSTAFIAAPAFAAKVDLNISIGAPPAPRYEAVPAPRHGYVWVPGFWDWNGHRHVWIAGHWERVRAGYAYRHPEWREVNGRWVLERGGWAPEHGMRDSDHDGVPDRVDRHPYNSHRD